VKELVLAWQKLNLKFKVVHQDSEQLLIETSIKAKAGSKKEKVALNDQDVIVVAVNSPALEGKANQSICHLLGKSLGLSSSKLEIISGDKSKDKRLLIKYQVTAGKSCQYFCQKLENLLAKID